MVRIGIILRLIFTNRGEMVECEAGPMFCRPKVPALKAELQTSGDVDGFLLNTSLDVQLYCGRTDARTRIVTHAHTYIHTCIHEN